MICFDGVADYISIMLFHFFYPGFEKNWSTAVDILFEYPTIFVVICFNVSRHPGGLTGFYSNIRKGYKVREDIFNNICEKAYL